MATWKSPTCALLQSSSNRTTSASIEAHNHLINRAFIFFHPCCEAVYLGEESGYEWWNLGGHPGFKRFGDFQVVLLIVIKHS